MPTHPHLVHSVCAQLIGVRSRIRRTTLEREPPRHLQLVNNLISSNHSEHADETHLPVDTPTWNKLATHMREIAVTPCRVCFQCGMVTVSYTHLTLPTICSV